MVPLLFAEEKRWPVRYNSVEGRRLEGTRWRPRRKGRSLHWILSSHNNTLHRSRRAARLFDRLLTHCGPANVNVRCNTHALQILSHLYCPWPDRTARSIWTHVFAWCRSLQMQFMPEPFRRRVHSQYRDYGYLFTFRPRTVWNTRTN